MAIFTKAIKQNLPKIFHFIEKQHMQADTNFPDKQVLRIPFSHVFMFRSVQSKIIMKHLVGFEEILKNEPD